MRTLLIVVDGMRPDAIAAMPQVQKILKHSSYTMAATTVMPSVPYVAFPQCGSVEAWNDDQYICAAGKAGQRVVRGSVEP